ncbi:MAG: thioredoxin family protein [Proteobacteria bacterium]|nr:thioredoxin family protein [Pseudomonadota bacterium]
MTPQDRRIIDTWQEQKHHVCQITLIKTNDERTDVFQNFLNDFVQVVPHVVMKATQGEDGEPPSIRVQENIIFHAIPSGPELSPFLNALDFQAEKKINTPRTKNAPLEKINVPARLIIFIAPHCAYCPVQVETLLGFSYQSKLIHLDVIDGVFFPELSRKYNIQSAPTVILDDTITWTGRTASAEILSMILDRDPSKMGTATLEGMLKSGEAFKLADMMIEKNMIFPSLIDLMVTAKWPVRLGAMVAIETIAEKNIRLAGAIVHPLMNRMPEMDANAKGDIVYIAGICGDESILPALESIRIQPETDEELQDAVSEAINAIMGRERFQGTE